MSEARGLAEVMGFFVGQLLGEPPDLDGPPLTDLPNRQGTGRAGARPVSPTPHPAP